MSQLQLHPRGAQLRCALCHASAEGSLLTCAGCGSAAHASCAQEWGRGCPSVGCRTSLARVQARPLPAPVEPPQAWPLVGLAVAGYGLGSLGLRWIFTGSPLLGFGALIVLLELCAAASVLLDERERAA